jgi:hypothetical protein
MGKSYDPQVIPEILDADGLYVLVHGDGNYLMVGEIQSYDDTPQSN